MLRTSVQRHCNVISHRETRSRVASQGKRSRKPRPGQRAGQPRLCPHPPASVPSPTGSGRGGWAGLRGGRAPRAPGDRPSLPHWFCLPRSSKSPWGCDIFESGVLCGRRVVPSPCWPQLQHHLRMKNLAVGVAWTSQAKASPAHPCGPSRVVSEA